ncbi:MAG TPA: nitronate monooxygenase [Acidimicrobiales bacterium]
MNIERFGALSRWPIAVAPMAGGPSTVDLVLAALEAGAFAFLAGGYKTADALAAEMAGVQAGTDRPFGVNLFVPGEPTESPAALASYVSSLGPDAAALGVELGEARWDDDDYPAKVAMLSADPPALVSFTFGCPSAEVVTALQEKGTLVAVTVTTPEEAMVALRFGVDALCLQGCEAGAHRGHFENDDRPDQDRPLYALLASVARRTRLPLLAAGGVMTSDDVVRVLRSGAVMAQLGTAFLRCPESGTHAVAKASMADPLFERTGVTRAYSGRRARGLVNDFMVERGSSAPAAYPEINNVTRPLRAAAAAAGDPHRMSLYAGASYRLARAVPVAEVVADLVSGLPA